MRDGYCQLLVSLIGLLLVALPLMPFIALAIKLDSPGSDPLPAAAGGTGRVASSFATNSAPCDRMRRRTPVPTWANDDDPRITRIGKFLRTSRLDEIPQLWCVLKGDMAFVGPASRAAGVCGVAEPRKFLTTAFGTSVRPGITGWAQVRYKYGNTIEDAKEKLQYDLFYIKNASLGLDVLIMFQTSQDRSARPGGAMRWVFWVSAALVFLRLCRISGVAMAPKPAFCRGRCCAGHE